MKRPINTIKEERKKAFFFRELAGLVLQIARDEPVVAQVYPTRVDFSDGGGTCYIYFASTEGKELFNEALEVLKLYRPSMRRVLAKIYSSRYTPDILFKYDTSLEKARKVESLLDDLRGDDDDEGS